MWQYAMNSPGNETCRFPGGGGDRPEIRRASRFLTLGCFISLTALHIAVFSVLEFFGKTEAPFAEMRELSLTLDFPAPMETEPEPPAAPLSPEAVLPEVFPEPAAEEIPVPPEEPVLVSPAETEIPVPVAAAFSAPAESAPAAGAAASSLAGSVPAGSGFAGSARKAPMTDAEYLDLVMGRLEKNKIYPLSVRKRGIEGDITVAFTIKRDGSVSGISLADPSGHRFLAQAAFETIRSSAPFPVMEGRDGDYTARVSIRYRLED
jgi:protein TonB